MKFVLQQWVICDTNYETVVILHIGSYGLSIQQTMPFLLYTLIALGYLRNNAMHVDSSGLSTKQTTKTMLHRLAAMSYPQQEI